MSQAKARLRSSALMWRQTVPAGAIAVNSGKFSDLDGNTILLSASIGNVARNVILLARCAELARGVNADPRHQARRVGRLDFVRARDMLC